MRNECDDYVRTENSPATHTGLVMEEVDRTVDGSEKRQGESLNSGMCCHPLPLFCHVQHHTVMYNYYGDPIRLVLVMVRVSGAGLKWWEAYFEGGKVVEVLMRCERESVHTCLSMGVCVSSGGVFMWSSQKHTSWTYTFVVVHSSKHAVASRQLFWVGMLKLKSGRLSAVVSCHTGRQRRCRRMGARMAVRYNYV